VNSASEAIALLRRNVGRVYVGHPEAVDLLMVALVVNGHVLVEDVPGTGKTTLLKALARSLGLSFSRIQCTPDLLPADITGLTYFDQRTGEWRFRAGPVLAHVVLVDEINRATPRTQSALLEAMEERQVTVDGETHPCPRPFLVLATQNPVEMDGTFPLPEAQLDRFMLRLHLGYPAAEDEEEMVRRHASSNLLAELEPVLRDTDIVELQKTAARVHVSDPVLHYVVEIVRATRNQEALRLGASPRASLALYRCSQAMALLRGRSYVLPDDVKAVAVPVLAHRIILGAAALLKDEKPEDRVRAVLAQVPVPAEPLAGVI